MNKSLRSAAKTKPPEKAAVLKDALLAAAKSPRTCRSLARVWDALETMRKRGEQDFRIASVAKELGDEGPGEQSIRNKSGVAYKQLIDAYAEEVTPPKHLVLNDHDEALVHQISDPSLSARVAFVLAQNKALRRRNDILHHQFARLTDVSASPVSHGTTVLPAGATPLDVTDEERKAARRFMQGVAKHSWEWDDETGALLDQRGNEIAPPYFLDALRRLMGSERALPERA